MTSKQSNRALERSETPNFPRVCEAKAFQVLPGALKGCTSTNLSNEVRSYFAYKLSNGIGSKRAKKLEDFFRVLTRWGFEPSTSDTRERLQEILTWVYRQPYSEWTKHDYLIQIKAFYRYHNRLDLSELVKPKTPRPRLLRPDELLTWEDILKMISTVPYSDKHRAFVALLYDSGCRVGELLRLETKDIYRDEHGARLYIEEFKTSPTRLVRLQRSFPILLEYLIHVKGRLFPDSYASYKKELRLMAKRSRITKPLNFHNFRKSRATELANHLSRAQLCKHFGWRQSSDMPDIYIHTTSEAVDEAILNLKG